MFNAPIRHSEYYIRPTSIIDLYGKATKIAEDLGDEKSAIKFLIEMAYFELYVKYDEPKAFKLYTQALRYAEEEKDNDSIAIICYGLAAINEHQNFRAEMYKYFFKSIEYSLKSPNFYYPPFRWTVHFLLEDNRVIEALKISQQAVNQVDKNFTPAEFKILAYGYHYGVLRKIKSKKLEADIYKQKIINLLSGVKTLTKSQSYDSFATVCYEVEQYKLAIFFANQIFEASDSDSKTESSRIVIYEIISKSYEKLGEYQKSLEYYKQYSTTYVSVLRNLFSLESGRKVIRAEGEQNLLLKEKEIEKEKLYRNISFAVAALIIFFGAVVFFFYRREQKQKAELARLNATKDRLFAILSHDLQSPIANLQTYMNLIQWGALNQEEFAESTDNFSFQLGNVRSMLENVLNWSISQMGGIKPKFETCKVQRIINEELELLTLSAKNKGIQIKNQIDESLALKADKNHLAFIFRNLVQNAIKFSNTGGEIDLSYAKENGKVKISVADNGVGMSDETLKQLFKLEQTNSKMGTNAEKGTGLGLILTKEFVEANGGNISVESQEGKGTKFTLTF
ncbi:MAG: sensor histidine kinase [Emticicia sp.]|uniref:sensor histidine kinase n=1 Tax=Emticicia sp. TaxID=1930953 RepID=UPI003BA51163